MKLQSFREVQLAFVFINLLQGLVTFLTIKQCSLSRCCFFSTLSKRLKESSKYAKDRF